MRILFILSFLVSIFAFGQNSNNRSRSELGVLLGGSYYLGDLNQFGHFNKTQPAVGLLYRYNYHSRLSFRANFSQKLNTAVDAYKNILIESDLLDKKARIDKDVTISIYFNLLEAYFAQRKTIEAETVLAALTQIDLSNREKKFKEKYAAAFLELTNRMAVNGL